MLRYDIMPNPDNSRYMLGARRDWWPSTTDGQQQQQQQQNTQQTQNQQNQQQQTQNTQNQNQNQNKGGQILTHK